MNAASLFRDAARAHPERVAFYEGREAVTFGALWERVERKSKAFRAGERALLMLPMSVDLYAALLAVLHANAVAVFIDPWVGTRRMIQLARFARPVHWIGTWKSQLLRLAATLAPHAATPAPHAATPAPHAAAPAPRAAAPAPRVILSRADGEGSSPHDPALITFTTGSSGTPKGVNRTHRILIAQHERLAEAFPPREGDVDLCTFPIFALNNLALGVTTLIPPIDLKRVDALDPQLVARVARERGATTATASPPLFDKLAPLADRPRFRRILTGGAPVTDAQLHTWIAAWPDAEIVIAYGSSEAEPVAHIEARERLAAGGRGYLAGRIVHGVRAKLDLIDDTVGELLVAGDHVATEHEWHRMGDTGWFDEEGRFRIAGRVHSTIWRNGVAYHAQLVEQAARGDDPRIRRVAAVGVDGRLVVVVEVDESTSRQVVEEHAAGGLDDSTTRRLVDSIRARVDADDVVIASEPLPLDPRHNSKIDYAKLREQLC